VIGVFVLTTWFINPIRETAMEDDWAYALTVRYLLETGDYQLNDWAAANMPFQIYWGGFFAHFLGYSFSSLRISTLVLVFVGLLFFYFLAIEHELNHIQAGLLTLCLFASPLVLRFSFNFMTDVPFLSCLIIALFFYTRAIRLHSLSLMLLASIVATAAILTRQFGVTLGAGLLFLWIFGKDRKYQMPFFLSGLILPVIAGIWQLYAGIVSQNWVAEYTTARQYQYFANTGDLLLNVLWRPTVLLQYLAFFSLPLVFLAILALVHDIAHYHRDSFFFTSHEFAQTQKGQNPGRRLFKFTMVLVGVFFAYILTGILYGHFVDQRPMFMPYLPWNFGTLKGILGDFGRGILTFITTIGGILFARIFVLRYSDYQGWKCLPLSKRLLDLVALLLLVFHLIYVDFGDEYLMVFLPFTLIVVGSHLKNYLNRFCIVTTIVCLAMLVASAMWTRGLASWKEACWQGGDLLLFAGVRPEQIYGLWEWNSYYKFQDYVDEFKNKELDLGDFFDRWQPEQRRQARFWIVAFLNPPVNETWRVIYKIPYENIFLQKRFVYVIRRENKIR
jgi:hypothetical protein